MAVAHSPAPAKLSSDERAEALAGAVNDSARHGWQIVSQTGSQAQLKKGKPTSHLLHLILSLVTLGIWLPVWIAVAIFAGEKHKMVSVDEYGRVTRS